MARKKSIVTTEEVKALLSEEAGFLKATITKLVQEALEAEMEEALQAAKSERNEDRPGYRSGY